MPISFHYDPDQNVLLETGTGNITLDELLEYRNKLETIGLQPGFKCLADYLLASMDVPYEEVNIAAKKSQGIAKNLGEVKLAICANEEVEYGMARMFSMIAAHGQFKVGVFRTVEEGREWLGL